jgi:tartrate-resistant acid phosphatase type 5
MSRFSSLPLAALACAPFVLGCGSDSSPSFAASGSTSTVTGGTTGGNTSSSATTGTGGASTTSSSSASGGNGGSGNGGSGGSGASGGSGGAGPVVRILSIGDTGEGNEAQNLVADQMSAKCLLVGGCDAVTVNGDNFYDQGVQSVDDPQWGPKFEQPYDRPGLNGLPFYVVLGNHDYGATSSGNKQAEIDYTFLPVGVGPGTRPSDKWTMPTPWYDVQIGHVQLFAFDTQDLSAAQETEMAQKVAMSTATWKIAVAHHPRYTSGDHFFDNQLLGFAGMYDLQQAIYCGTDMFMTGHDHNREFIDKGRDASCPDTHFVISGAASKVRERSGLVPDDPSQLHYDETNEGFVYLEFNGNTLLVEFIDKDGSVSYTKTITK